MTARHLDLLSCITFSCSSTKSSNRLWPDFR
jgi:hypothetical protein